MECPRCKSDVPEVPHFCHHCGADLLSGDAARSKACAAKPDEPVASFRVVSTIVFCVRVAAVQPYRSQANLMPSLMNAEKNSTGITNFQAGQVRTQSPPTGRDTDIEKVTSQTYTADLNGQNGTTKVVGYVAVVDNKVGLTTVVKFFGRRDRAEAEKTDLQNMLASVTGRQ